MLDLRLLAPGTVLNIKKYRGEDENYVGRVVETRDTHSRPVKSNTRGANIITRSQWLFTLEATDTNAEQKFKSFYHAFVDEVEVKNV